MSTGVASIRGTRGIMADLNPWELVQNRLKTVLDEHAYKNWFAPTKFHEYRDGALVVSVPSDFFAEWLRDHYMEAISDSVRSVLPDFREVTFVVSAASGSEEADDVPPPITPRRADGRNRPRLNFNSRYSFNRFVIGSGNRFAYAAAKAVAESPGASYNPLFLYGGTGLGKTHLMQAIGREIVERNPNANVMYIASEHFTNQLVEGIAKKTTQAFRDRYRQVDILLIDDIHFVAGKDGTQEELFHTFNALFDKHKQIVLTSDRGPKEIKPLESRLVSRFEWGLVTDIQPPDLETRMAILQNKAAEENVSLPDDVIRFIATHVVINVRELEGALITVLAYCRLTKKPITIKLVEDVLSDLIGNDMIRPITIEAVQRAVAEHFDVRISDLWGSSRQRQVAFPRQIAMYFCKKLIPSLSLSEIGEAFGGRDHSTIVHGCQKIEREKGASRDVAQTIAAIERVLRGNNAEKKG